MSDFFNTLVNAVLNTFTGAHQWLFETWVQPAMFTLGLGNLLEDGFTATQWFMLGVLQIVLLIVVIGPLQRWRPVDAITDRATIRTDFIYTLIHRLGLFRLVLFFTVQPFLDDGLAALRGAGVGTFHVDALWPGVTDVPWVSLLMYLVILDFVDYWIHRGQHHFGWWWKLHSLHHAQRQMTMFSDNRNHLLDDLLRDVLIVITAQLIGVAPSQFVAVGIITQLSESFQHANVRLWFGSVGERLWVSPRFHRLHHSIGLGHESNGKASLGGKNFGVLLPWWDMLFRTGNFEIRYDKTGVRDQVEPGPDGKLQDYGRGFWSQQWLGCKRLLSSKA